MNHGEWMKKMTAHPLWQRWQAWRHPGMVCVLLAGKLWAADLKEGRFLRTASVPLEEMTENAVAAAFRALAEQGMKRKEILLLVNFPDLRLENRKYPAMTEEEMVETMYWEEDRLFRTEEPMAPGWEVTSHSPLGWEVHVEAVKKETLSLWEKGATLAGCHVGKALPVTAVPLSEEPHFILYGRKQSAILIFRKDRLLRSRILRKEEKGKGALFMERCLANFNIQKGTCFFLPLSDCGREEETFWKERMKEEIEREGENGLLPGSLTMAENFLSDYGGWADMEVLFRRLSSGRLTLPLTEKRKSFITEENRTLRTAQGLCLVSLLFFLLAGGEFLSAENRPAPGRGPAEAAERTAGGSKADGREGKGTGTAAGQFGKEGWPVGRKTGPSGRVSASGHCDFLHPTGGRRHTHRGHRPVSRAAQPVSELLFRLLGHGCPEWQPEGRPRHRTGRFHHFPERRKSWTR